MLDTTKTFFYGVATDLPDADYKKKPEQPKCAVNDIVYYFAPGERQGKTASVLGYWRDDDERIKVKIHVTATGEEIDVYQTQIRY